MYIWIDKGEREEERGREALLSFLPVEKIFISLLWIHRLYK